MPVSKYGLLEEDPNAPGSTGSANISGVTQNPAANAANLNPFGTPRTVTPLGAAPVIPGVQQFAFNPKYAAQSAGLEQMLADQGLNRSNQLGAVDADWARAKSEGERGRTKALEGLINKYASSGILGSGIDALSRGEMETNFQRYLGDLELNRGNAKNAVEGAYAQAINAVNAQRGGMFAAQQKEEEDARIQAARDKQAADEAEANRQNALRIAQEARAAQEAAAASQPAPWTPPYAPGAGGTGGGGGAGGVGGQYQGQGGGAAGWGSAEAAQAGIGPNDTIQDIQNQVALLQKMGSVHQLSVLYSAPEMNHPGLLPFKNGIRSWISGVSTPGAPGYIPSDYSNPGGFY